MIRKSGLFARKGIESFLVVMMSVMFITVCLQVFFRYVLLKPLSWSEELARYCFVWLSFIGAAMALGQKLHFGIDYLVNKFPPRIRAGLALATNILVLIFCLVMVIYGYKTLATARYITSAGLYLRMDFVFSAIPAAGLIMIYFVLNHMFQDFMVMIGKREPDPIDVCEEIPELDEGSDNENNPV